MADLREFSIIELKEELMKREKIIEKKPKPLSNPDFRDLIKECVEYIDGISSSIGDYDTDDGQTWIFEKAISAVFGNKGWDYIHEVE